MDKEIDLNESETTVRFGMRIVAFDKSRRVYLGDAGSASVLDSARKFSSVAEAKEACLAAGITNYRIVAHVPGAVSAHSVVLSETGPTSKPKPSDKPRFD